MTARGKRRAGHEHARKSARKWVAVTAFAPALLLPATLLAASSSFLTAPDGARPPRDLGVNGQLPQAPTLSPQVLERAADPRHLATDAGPETELPSGSLGIPEPVLGAYLSAARAEERCGLHWSVLASIGRIESGHARDGSVDRLGTTSPAILGPRLSGGLDIAAIQDTDGGVYDGDPVWDRAVGPMQFIPSTWLKYAVDGNQDGVASPHNIHDASLAAAQYLCAGGGNLRNPRDLAAAVFGYNHSDRYVRTVLIWADAYANGVTPTPAELAPEVDDALAGERLPDGSAAQALAPPAPVQPALPPAPPAPAPAQPPAASAPPGPSAPNGIAPPELPELTPPSIAPPDLTTPPSSTQPGTPPSSTQPGVPPPGSQPGTPPSSTQPGTPPNPTQPGAPPSSTQPGTPPPSGVPAPPSSTEPPATSQPGKPPEAGGPPVSTPPPAPPATTTPPESPRPPAESAPPSPQPPSSTPPSSTTPPSPAPTVPESCDPAVLSTGEFALADQPGVTLEPGRTDPSAALPGQTVYVEAETAGLLKPCVVPGGATG